MSRIHRVAVGLLAAYAASMTLLAARRSAEAQLYRRLYDLFTRSNPAARRPEDFPLWEIARDFGLDLTRLEIWSLRIADVQGSILVPLIALFFLLGLGAALIRSPSRSKLPKD